MTFEFVRYITGQAGYLRVLALPQDTLLTRRLDLASLNYAIYFGRRKHLKPAGSGLYDSSTAG